MTRSGFCGIDVGTQGVRVVVIDCDGRVVASGGAALPPGTRPDGGQEQDPTASATRVLTTDTRTEAPR